MLPPAALPPAAALPALRASTASLSAGLESERWSDADVRAPALVPGWTRTHVLTHIARNADGINRALAGVLRGEIVPRYPNGRAGRDADIEAGSTRGSVELLADVRESSERLDRVLAAVAEADQWDRPTEDRPAGEYVLARWREVEVHRVDLAGGYRPADWPPEFVSYLLPELAATVADRASNPVRIEVVGEGSVTTDLPGHSWADNAGPPAELVRGPDWAVLAWLTGRLDEHTASQLSGTPELAPWI